MAFIMLDQAAIDRLTNIFAEGAKRMRQAAEDVDRLGEKIRAQLAEKEVDGNWQPVADNPPLSGLPKRPFQERLFA